MIMAPDADIADGLLDFIRVEPMGRLAMVRALLKMAKGTHVEHPLITAVQAREIRFELDEATSVVVDGELVEVLPRSIEVLPRALEVCV